MSVVVSGSSVPAFPIAIARPESALPTTYIIGYYSALAPSPIVGVGVLPLAVESSAEHICLRVFFPDFLTGQTFPKA